METSGDVGFTQYARVERLEAQPLFKPSPSNLAVQASAGVRAWCRPAASQSEDIKQRQSELPLAKNLLCWLTRSGRVRAWRVIIPNAVLDA